MFLSADQHACPWICTHEVNSSCSSVMQLGQKEMKVGKIWRSHNILEIQFHDANRQWHKEGGRNEKRSVTKQYGEDQADGSVGRAQLWGLDPKPLDLHGSQVCSKTNTATGASPGAGQIVEYELAQFSFCALWVWIWILLPGPKTRNSCSRELLDSERYPTDCRLDRGQRRK